MYWEFNLLFDRRGDKIATDQKASNCQNLKWLNQANYTMKNFVEARLQTSLNKLFLDENDGYVIPRKYFYLQNISE